MSRRPIPILMYHSIETMPKGTVMRSLHVPPKLFSLQMKLLKLLGYRGLSMSELMPYLQGDKTGKVVGVTFDDGYRNNLGNALPILKKYNFSATCYLVSQNIGGNNYWDQSKGIPKMDTMDQDEVKNWLDHGMEIGSHAQHHVRLSQCDANTLVQEVTHSKKDLEQQFDRPVEHFCYPYGDHNEAVVSAVERAGYLSATTVRRSRVKPSDNLLALPRVFVTHRTFVHLFLMKVLGTYEDKHS